MSCLFLLLTTYLSNIVVSATQTLSEIKSQGIMGHIKQHFITTSPLTYVANGIQDFVKMLYTMFAATRPSTRQHAIW